MAVGSTVMFLDSMNGLSVSVQTVFWVMTPSMYVAFAVKRNSLFANVNVLTVITAKRQSSFNLFFKCLHIRSLRLTYLLGDNEFKRYEFEIEFHD